MCPARCCVNGLAVEPDEPGLFRQAGFAQRSRHSLPAGRVLEGQLGNLAPAPGLFRVPSCKASWASSGRLCSTRLAISTACAWKNSGLNRVDFLARLIAESCRLFPLEMLVRRLYLAQRGYMTLSLKTISPSTRPQSASSGLNGRSRARAYRFIVPSGRIASGFYEPADVRTAVETVPSPPPTATASQASLSRASTSAFSMSLPSGNDISRCGLVRQQQIPVLPEFPVSN